MNRDILNEYREKDDKILLAQILDKVEAVENKNKIEHTDFLDMSQIELVQKFINKIKITNYMTYGGFEQAERKMYVIYPEKFNTEEAIKQTAVWYGEYLNRNDINNITEKQIKNYIKD